MRAPARALACLVAAALPLLAALPQPGDAQTRAPRDGQELTREEIQRRVLRGFEQRVVRELGLDEIQTERLRATTLEFRDARRELMRERTALRREIRRFTGRAGTDDEARRLLEGLRGLRAREAGLQRHEEERLLEFLAPGQVLRLHVLREDFAERIRRLEAGERGAPSRPSPPGRRGPRGPGPHR